LTISVHVQMFLFSLFCNMTSTNDASLERMAKEQQRANDEMIKAAAKDTDMCKNPKLHTVPKNLEKIFKKGVELVDTLTKEGTLNCDEDCLYQKNKEKLKQNMNFAKSNYVSAPQLLRDAEQKYYMFTRQKDGKGYDEYQQEQVDIILKDKIDVYQKRFEKYSNIVKLINAETDETRRSEMQSHLQNLQTLYKADISRKEKDVLDNSEMNKIADRETFYMNDSIDVFRSFNLIMMTTYFSAVFLYVFVFLYVYQEYISVSLVKTRIFRILPFVLIGVMCVLLYMYVSEKPLFQLHYNENPVLDNTPVSESTITNDPFQEDISYPDPNTHIQQQKDIIQRQKQLIEYQKAQLSQIKL